MLENIIGGAAGNLISAVVIATIPILMRRRWLPQRPESSGVPAVVTTTVDGAPARRSGALIALQVVLILTLLVQDFLTAHTIWTKSMSFAVAMPKLEAISAWTSIGIALAFRLFVIAYHLQPRTKTVLELRDNEGYGKYLIRSLLRDFRQAQWGRLYGWCSTLFWAWLAIGSAIFRA